MTVAVKVVSTFSSYVGGPGLIFQSGDQISYLGLVVLLSLFRQLNNSAIKQAVTTSF
jgi:hypothetical protein